MPRYVERSETTVVESVWIEVAVMAHWLWSTIDLTESLGITFLVLLVSYFIQCIVRYRNVPPGPWGLPFVGYLPFIGNDMTVALKKLRNKYGEIFSLRLGQRFFVVFNSWNTVSEAYLKQAEIFAGRPKGFTKLDWYFNSKSLVSLDGYPFKEQKKILLRSFRDFGFGKLSLEGKIQEEAKEMISYLKEHGNATDVAEIFNITTANIICAIMFGKRFEYDDPKLRNLVKHVCDIMVEMGKMSFVELFPTFSFLPENLLDLGPLIKAKKNLKEFVNEIIDEHIETFDENNLRDAVDDYLLKMKEMKMDFNEEENGTFYSRSYIRENLILMFIAGTETTASVLYWGIKFLLAYPEIQRKIQEEIDSVIGRSRLPSWNDRHNLPFTEATINEIQRMATIATVPLPHSNIEETLVNGYRIPKRSFLLMNMLELNHDPLIWKDPDTFDPNRFLDENGKLLKLEHFIPFSLGPRLCIGITLAKMELLIFFTTLLQNFNFTSNEEQTKDFEIRHGLVRKPTSFQVNINLR